MVELVYPSITANQVRQDRFYELFTVQLECILLVNETPNIHYRMIINPKCSFLNPNNAT